jgi:hypothetical protein
VAAVGSFSAAAGRHGVRQMQREFAFVPICDNGRLMVVLRVRVRVLVLVCVGLGLLALDRNGEQCGGRDCGRAQAPA